MYLWLAEMWWQSAGRRLACPSTLPQQNKKKKKDRKKKKVKNTFNTCLYTLINILNASFTINIKVQAKEGMTGINISCKHYRSLYIFRGKSNAPKLQALYIKYCTIFINIIKYAKTHQYGRFIEKFNNKIETTWTILKLFWNYCFLLYQNFSPFPSHKWISNTWTIV